MSDKTDMGGHSPAHPVVTGNHVHATGMTVWDRFAESAMNGILAGPCGRDGVPATEWMDVPEQAAKLADAMLAERTKRTGGNS